MYMYGNAPSAAATKGRDRDGLGDAHTPGRVLPAPGRSGQLPGLGVAGAAARGGFRPHVPGPPGAAPQPAHRGRGAAGKGAPGPAPLPLVLNRSASCPCGPLPCCPAVAFRCTMDRGKTATGAMPLPLLSGEPDTAPAEDGGEPDGPRWPVGADHLSLPHRDRVSRAVVHAPLSGPAR